jgi:hypothetical protein
MNKCDAFKSAEKTFPTCKPSRICGMTLSEDGKAVFIAGHEEDVVFVLHNKTDLHRVMSMCHMALYPDAVLVTKPKAVALRKK